MTATEDDSGTNTAEENGDTSDGMNPIRLECLAPGERADDTLIREDSSEGTIPLSLAIDSNGLNMAVLDRSAL